MKVAAEPERRVASVTRLRPEDCTALNYAHSDANMPRLAPNQTDSANARTHPIQQMHCADKSEKDGGSKVHNTPPVRQGSSYSPNCAPTWPRKPSIATCFKAFGHHTSSKKKALSTRFTASAIQRRKRHKHNFRELMRRSSGTYVQRGNLKSNACIQRYAHLRINAHIRVQQRCVEEFCFFSQHLGSGGSERTFPSLQNSSTTATQASWMNL